MLQMKREVIMKGTAYFVKKPSKLRDLMRPHRIEDVQQFLNENGYPPLKLNFDAEN